MMGEESAHSHESARGEAHTSLAVTRQEWHTFKT